MSHQVIYGRLILNPRSLASRTVQASLWPMLLRADTSNPSHHFHRRIQLLSYSVTVLAILGGVAGVVTPLGLGEELTSLRERSGTFAYTQDNSPYWAGTSPRGKGIFHRRCSDKIGAWTPCPYTGDVVEKTEKNGTLAYNFPYGLRTPLPDIPLKIFSSGTAGNLTTVSNFFDIEWRQLSTKKDVNYNNNTEYEIGLYRQLDSLLLQGEFKVLEGLVVDGKSGGIGFRNHTMPTNLKRGATWEEDLLFIEPDVRCVNTNLTFDFEISTNNSDMQGYRNLVITDRGGFVNINTAYTSFGLPKSQTNPDLEGRAYEAALLNNAYTMMIYNVTNPSDNRTGRPPYSYIKSQIGATLPLNATNWGQFSAVRLSNQFGDFLGARGLDHYPNPYNITPSMLRGINNVCTGVDEQANNANISNVYVACGLLRGAPMRVDRRGSSTIFENGSKWSSSLHSCAATVRAAIKTVSFAYNATRTTQGLEGLTVTGIKPKAYASDNDYPLWGFEESGLQFGGFNPIWGLISPEYEFYKNVSSVRRPFFNIPGLRSTITGLGFLSNNLAASNFATLVMDQVFDLDKDWGFDLLGRSSMSVFMQWQSLSSDATKSSKIIKLLWTDLATSAVVGTKGVLGHLNNGMDGHKVVPINIRPVAQSITYKIPYGIPAFLLLLLIAIMSIASIIATCFGKASIARLRRRIQQMSPGRIYTTYLYPEQSSLVMPSKEWVKKNGHRLIKLTSISEADSLVASESRTKFQQEAHYAQGIQQGVDSSQSPPIRLNDD
ncbi:hypothetical protein HIM_06699 [Hirsutella minnesotensis 3608]|uniref:Uncharacterized protein n=1 Tax=Hirsutella minnesotensis 3608 TaxID=1043627 RepID=A0A0F7ZIK7_9HYPO|nr:hypothetical protein HIM_06699 [Hirsutella minnesotensis 3608]